MPPDDVPELGEADLQTALQDKYGADSDTVREAISEWLEQGDSLAIWRRDQDGSPLFQRVAAGSYPSASPTWSLPYSLVGVIKPSPIGRIE